MVTLTKSTSCSTIENLPLLPLELVCEYLSNCDTGRRSLFAFSLASKLCCAATSRQRFEQVVIAPRDPKHLEQILKRCNKVFRSDGRTKYIRRARISGQITYEGGSVNQYFREEQLHMWINPDDSSLDEMYTFSTPAPLQSFHGSEPACTQENKSIANRGWEPTAQFLASCAGLKDLYWASTDQVPRCILEVLHNHLPRCRLHVHTFSLRSLYQQQHQHHDMDVDEYALATSPSLHSICVSPTYTDSWRTTDYNEEAALKIIAPLAPNLRSVCLWQQLAESSPQLQSAKHTTHPPWQRFRVNGVADGKTGQGHLWNLSFRGTSSLYLEKLQNWSRHTNLRELRSLELSVRASRQSVQTLIHMAEEGSLENLQKFCFRGLTDLIGHYADVEFRNLLQALPPLSVLTDESGNEERRQKSAGSRLTFPPIVERHAQSLKTFQTSNWFSLADLHTLRQKCPNLRELRVKLRHTDRNEDNKLFQVLGSFPRIEKLSIALYHPYPLNEEAEHELPTGLIATDYFVTTKSQRSSLIARAMDIQRAQSAFKVLLDANRAARPGIIPSLQSLVLRSVGDGQPWSDLEQLLTWVGRSWFLERKFADVDSDDAVVREVVLSGLLELRDELSQVEDERVAWEEVWPEAKGREDWLDVWCSLP